MRGILRRLAVGVGAAWVGGAGFAVAAAAHGTSLNPVAAAAHGTLLNPMSAAAHTKPLDPLAEARYLGEQRAGFGSPAQAAKLAGRAEAKAQALRARAVRLTPSPRFQAPTAPWQALGPTSVTQSIYGGPNSGRVDSVAVASNGNIFAGTAGGGVWESTNNGTSWTTTTDQVATGLAIGAIAVDPTNPSIVYAGTGEANNCGDCFYGGGVLKSTDGGATWTVENPTTAQSPNGIFSGVDFASIVVDPNSPATIYAGTDHGLFESTNGGSTWAQPSGIGLDKQTYGIVLNPSPAGGGGTNVYAAVQNEGIEESVAGGAFALVGTGLPAAANFGNAALGIAASTFGNPGGPTLYASVGLIGTTDPTNGGGASLFKSTDGGTTWTRVTAVPAYTNQSYGYGTGTADQAFYDNTIAVDPASANHVIVAGIGVAETIDGGATWSNVNGHPFFSGIHPNVIHPDFHALTFASGENVLMGCDGGVYGYASSATAIAGRTAVSSLNSDLNTTQAYQDLAVYNNGAQILAGLQDNGTVLGPASSASSGWPNVNSGDGGYSLINNPLPSVQFSQADQDLYATTDTWNSTLNRITPTATAYAPGNFVEPLGIIPNASTPSQPTVFLGAHDLWVTQNPTAATPSWTQLTTNPADSPSTGALHDVSAITIAPSNPSVMYVGLDDGTLMVSKNATSATPTFSTIASGVIGWITHIDVSPGNPGLIALSFSSGYARFSPVTPLVTTEAVTLTGTPSGNPTDVTGNLPTGVASSSVLWDGSGLIVATDVGVFATSVPSGGSTSWSALGTALPNVQVLGLTIDPDGHLYAATHGRGIWELALPPAAFAVPGISGSAVQGQTLTESPGSWVSSPMGFNHQWEDCDSSGAGCIAIAGATAQTYTLQPSDVGHTIRVTETATNAGGAGAPASSGATSIVVPLPPSAAAPPSISGSAVQGQTLTESHAQWSNNPTSFAYQWYDCDSSGAACVAIPGATAQTYTLQPADAGHTVVVIETASNAGGSGGPVSSTLTTVVVGLTPPPSLPQQPPGPPPLQPLPRPVPVCKVPNVLGKSLRASRNPLKAANCAVGKVRGPGRKPKRGPGRHRKWAAVVVGESPGRGSKRSKGAKVALRLVWKAVKA